MTFDAEKLVPSEVGRRDALRTAVRGDVMAALVLGGLGLVAYRHLIGFDPATLPSQDLHGVEGLLFEPSGSSPLLVFASAAWLFARRAGRLRRALGAPGRPFLAALLLAPSFALAVWSYYVGVPTLLVPSLSLAVLGGALLLGGTLAARAVLLPALFLLFAVPIPPSLLNRFMYDLQLATAGTAANVLDALGIHTVSYAERIYHGDHVFEVIESCSGVRSVETLFMSSFLYHDLFYRSRLQSTLVVLSSIAIGLLVNALRVMSIVLNPYSHFAAVHATQGLVMIVLGVFLIAGVDRVLTIFLPARPRWRRTRGGFAFPRWRFAALVVWTATLALSSAALRPWQAERAPETPLASLPLLIDGYTATSIQLDRQFLGSTTFSEWVHRSYARDAEAVDVFLASNRRLDERIDFGSRKLGILQSGWKLTGRRPERLESGRVVERLELEAPREGTQIVYLWTTGVGSGAEELSRAALAFDRGPWRRSGRALAVRLATPAGDVPGAADARLHRFAASVERELARIVASDPT